METRSIFPYPRTFEEFLESFATEEDCVTYLASIRWPKGFVCPTCGESKAWCTDRGLWHCQGCQRQTSATSGTVFDGSRKPLRLWFHVMWLMMAQKTGLSAKNLCDTYGFGSYQTAWGWLRKLRSVMIRSGRERLRGRVEVDEAYIGGQKEGTRGRGAEGKTLVLVAVEGEAKYADCNGSGGLEATSWITLASEYWLGAITQIPTVSFPLRPARPDIC